MSAVATSTPALPYGPPADPVPYATPVPRPSAKAWAGAAILFGGLCLILLGGCFLIGVLFVVGSSTMNSSNYPAPPLTGPQALLMTALYVLAFAGFAGAAAMLFVGTRGLLRVMKA